MSMGQMIDSDMKYRTQNPDEDFAQRSIELSIEANFLPIGSSIAEKKSLLGVFAKYGNYNNRDLADNYVYRSEVIKYGISFYSRFGWDVDNPNWLINMKIGGFHSEQRVRGEKDIYTSTQFDNGLFAFVKMSHWREDLNFLNCHRLIAEFQHPLKSDLEAFYSGEVLDNMDWKKQIMSVEFTESIASFFLDSDEDWLASANIYLGGQMEYVLNIDKQSMTRYTYPWVGVGLSCFKVPYHYQRMVEIKGGVNFGTIDQLKGFRAELSVNLVSLYHFASEKIMANL